MTKISTYVVDEKVTALDKWIGSDANMQNRTKNFTPKKLAAYFNEDQVINIGTPLQYKYYTLDPLEARPNGTLTFETEIGPTVNFSSITTFLLSKYTTKQNIVSDFLNFLDGSKVLLFKSSDINSFGFYRISSLEPYEPDPNFFVLTVDYETGNGVLEEDEDYMISLVSLAGDFIPTKTSELINDGDDGVNPFISELDINRTEWDEAYEGKINSAEVTGDTTKTLTLTKQDGSTIEASWTDDNTDAVTSVFGRDGDVVAETGDYNTDQVTEGDNLYFTEGRSRSSVSLTTTGSNGEATYDSITGVFNIPNYSEDLVDYVPYTGATKDVNLGIHQLKADSLAVSITSAEAVDIGGIVWNPIDGTFDMGLIGGVTLQAGQELHMYGKATEAISNGQAVMFSGVQGDHILIAKADAATINANPEYFIGIATQNFANNQFGYVTVFGNVRGLNTTAYTLGSVLYYNSESSTDGLLTATEPTAPNAKIIVAAVVRVHATQGILLVRPHVMPKLKNIQDVYAPSPSDKNGLFWNNANSRYENNSISGILGYTPANDSAVVKLTGVQTIAGIKTFSESTKFDYGVYLKQDGVTASFPGYTTIDGITNGYVVTNGDARTAFFNLANVTSLVYTYPSTAGTFALTSDLHSPVTIGTANGLSLSGQQLSLGLASSSTNGALSSTDWNSFNNKQSAGSYITSLTGEATATGPGAASVTLNNASVTAKILSGVNITGGTILDTDTMLTAFGKLQNQINSLIGGSVYQGVWNANTNTPTLASSVGTDGNYYIVNVAGSTNLNGITDWKIGDWAIFHGGTWQKVDNTDAVSSVNGFTGAVSLTTDNISEGSTNLYFTNSRARASLSFTAGSGAYNNTTGVITIPTNTSQLTNGANYITLASLSGTAPIGYNNTTGSISITQAGTSSNGYLSSTDWNTFNNKQNALSGTGFVKISGTTISYDNNTYALDSAVVKLTGTQVIAGLKTFSGAIVANSQINLGLGSPIYFADSTNSAVAIISNTSSNGTTLGITSSLATFTGNINALSFIKSGGTSSQFLKADGTVDSSVYVPTSRTLTINGTAYDLSANRSWTIPTHDAVTIGTANGLSLSGQVLSLGLASTSTNGALSATDWNIFNSKIGGSGTTNYLSKFTGASTLGNSLIYDNGTNVGIGTTSPSSPLMIRVLSDNNIRFHNDAGIAQIACVNDAVSAHQGFKLGNNWMNFLSSGNVGIGTTSPSAKTAIHKSELGSNPSAVLRLENTGANYTSKLILTDGTTNDANISYIGSNQSLGFGVGSSLNQMIISSSGNVGIGTTNPIYKLDILSSNPRLRIKDTSTGSILIDMEGGAGSFYIGSDNSTGSGFGGSPYAATLYRSGNYPISMWTNNSEKFRINGNGNVGIGTSSPVYKFHVNDTSDSVVGHFSGGVSNYTLISFKSNEPNVYSTSLGSYNSGMLFRTGATDRMYINSSGNVGIGTTSPSQKLEVSGNVLATGFFNSSDIRLKHLIDYNYDVNSIKAITYTWKDNSDSKIHIGYSAQEVQKVLPDAVSENNEGFLSVDYIQVLVAKIEMLENRIKQLENGLE